MGEEYRSRTMPADQRGFFAEMRVEAGNPGRPCRLAHSGFSGQPGHTASARAQRAAGKPLAGLLGPAVQETAAKGWKVGRFKEGHGHFDAVDAGASRQLKGRKVRRRFSAPGRDRGRIV